MKGMRALIATAAVAALLTIGAVVAFAAPHSLGRAVSPSASAARAVYCPAGDKRRRGAALRAYQQRASADRKRYYAKHHQAKARRAFLAAQQKKLRALVRALAQCK
ncbi:MAG: hypothetical protein ACR2MU_02430 [Gaiellaceae bacterium]